jgi:hypothetical protein
VTNRWNTKAILFQVEVEQKPRDGTENPLEILDCSTRSTLFRCFGSFQS